MKVVYGIVRLGESGVRSGWACCGESKAESGEVKAKYGQVWSCLVKAQ